MVALFLHGVNIIFEIFLQISISGLGKNFRKMKEMVHMSRATDLVKKYGATVISPGYRLSVIKPFPAAIEDCYDALVYLKNHMDELGVNKNQIMVGGESADEGLCVAVCMMARDKGGANIAYRNSLPVRGLIDTQFPQGSWEADRLNKVCQSLHSGTGQFLSGFALR